MSKFLPRSVDSSASKEGRFYAQSRIVRGSSKTNEKTAIADREFFHRLVHCYFGNWKCRSYTATHRSVPNPAVIEDHYAQHAAAASLYLFPRVTGADDPIIYGGLVKSQLTKLYTQYFVPDEKPGRRLYEAIKVSAKGKCPLCGGVGQFKTLDHYLPKAISTLFCNAYQSSALLQGLQ